MKIHIVCLSLLAPMSTADAAPVSETRTSTESYPVATSAPHLTIKNIWGNVRVRPGPAGTISVVIDEKRSAPSQELFELSLDVLKLNVETDVDGVSIYVGENNKNWQRRDSCLGCRVDYQFEVTVPPGTQLDVGTVNDGRIDVAGISGMVRASNVNGPISVSEIVDCSDLESVNGAVDVSFSVAPGQNCNIETINGDIAISLPDGSGIDVALDLFNGRMTTEFEVDSYALPAQVEQSTDNGHYRYRILQSAGLRLDGGGPTFSISSLNGDIQIRKN